MSKTKENDETNVENSNETIEEKENISSEEKEIDNTEKELEKQIGELQKKVTEYETLVKIKMADFENYKKRIKQEKDSLSDIVAEQVILDFLPVLDNFERAIKSAKENKDINAFLTGIESIHDIFLTKLEKYGIKQINSIGKEFDPKLHHALHTIEGDYEKPTVIDEMDKLFMRKDRVIRTSKVSVGMPKKNKDTQKQEKKQEN